MTDELRAHRDALLRELAQVEQALHAQEGRSTLNVPQAWNDGVARAPEFLTVSDDQDQIRFTNRVQLGVDDAVGRSVFDFASEPSHALMKQALADMRATGLPQHFLSVGLGPNGEPSEYSCWMLPLSGTCALGPVAYFAIDISHMRRVEHERDQFTALVANAPDSIMILDREHRIRFVNRLAHGFTADQVVGQKAVGFIHESERERVTRAIESVFETGEPCAYQTRLQSPEGEFWFSSRVGQLDGDGHGDRVSVISTNITEQSNWRKPVLGSRKSSGRAKRAFGSCSSTLLKPW